MTLRMDLCISCLAESLKLTEVSKAACSSLTLLSASSGNVVKFVFFVNCRLYLHRITS